MWHTQGVPLTLLSLLPTNTITTWFLVMEKPSLSTLKSGEKMKCIIIIIIIHQVRRRVTSRTVGDAQMGRFDSSLELDASFICLEQQVHTLGR